MENAIVRVPALEEMEVVKLINGPEAFTPDGEFILGPSDVRGFWVAAGFCAHGLAGAGGMGKLVAEWIVEGTPSLDVWHMDSRRFGAAYRTREYTLARTTEIYETYYDVKYPGHEREAGRPLRSRPPMRGCRSSARRSARSRAGSARTGSSRTRRPATSRCARAAGPASSGRRRSAPSTAPAARRPRSSTSRRSRRSTSSGEGAAEFLEWLCANRVARDVGAVTYTQMLNARGGIECDFTVTRLAEDRFRIVTGTAFGQHDLAWIRQHAPDDGSVHVADVTSALRLPRAVGPEGPRDPRAADDAISRTTSRTCGRRSSRSAPCRASRSGSRTSASSAGSSTARPSSGSALGHDLGGRPRARPRRRRLQGDRLAPAREGLPRLGRRHHARRHAVRGRARLRGQARQGLPRAGRARSRPASRSGARLPRRSTTRARSRSAPSRCASATRSSAGSRAAATATRSSARSRTRTCPREREIGTPVAVEIFGEWVDGEVAAEPLYDPSGERIRG